MQPINNKIIIIIIAIMIFLSSSSYFHSIKHINMEGYADIAPYGLHWDIFKCLDMNCVQEKGYKCHEWCNMWAEPGAQQNCRMRCEDFSDIQAEQLKFMDYRWNYLLPKFKLYSLLNDDKYVMDRKNNNR